MSITTMGWGSGAITTQGWGAGAVVEAELVVAPPSFGLAGDLLHLIIQLHTEVRCKVTSTTLQAQLDAVYVQLDDVESCYAELFSKMRAIEGVHPLVFHVEGEVDCKFAEADFDTQRAAVDVGMDAISSDLQGQFQRLRALEHELRLLRKKRRTP